MNIFEGQQIGTMGKSGFGTQEYEKYLSRLHYEI
jgi:murein DD-endopeptidase MepM/ murein hydrolase activator NlpD